MTEIESWRLRYDQDFDWAMDPEIVNDVDRHGQLRDPLLLLLRDDGLGLRGADGVLALLGGRLADGLVEVGIGRGVLQQVRAEVRLALLLLSLLAEQVGRGADGVELPRRPLHGAADHRHLLFVGDEAVVVRALLEDVDHLLLVV